jgi:hypothetical protein
LRRRSKGWTSASTGSAYRSALSNAHLSVIDLWPEGVERTLLFVHGYAGVAETWEYQLSHFARLPGGGARPARPRPGDAPFTNYTMDELVEDIETVRQALRSAPSGQALFGGSICVGTPPPTPSTSERSDLYAGEYPCPITVGLPHRRPPSGRGGASGRWNAKCTS